jgi:hypothetical protein
MPRWSVSNLPLRTIAASENAARLAKYVIREMAADTLPEATFTLLPTKRS